MLYESGKKILATKKTREPLIIQASVIIKFDLAINQTYPLDIWNNVSNLLFIEIKGKIK